MPSTLGISWRDWRVGCSGLWPARKLVADLVRTRRMEREGWWESDCSMRGIFMVATEPDAASRRCFFPSL